MHILTKVATGLALAASLAACAQGTSSGQNLAEKTGDTIGCQSFQQTFWNEMDQIALDDQIYPSESQMRVDFDSALARRLPSVSSSDRAALAERLTDLYRTLVVDAAREQKVDVNAKEEILALVTSAELGDRSTDEKSRLQDTLKERFDAIEAVVQSLDPAALPACGTTQPTPPPAGSKTPSGPAPTPAPSRSTLFAEWKATRHPAVYGGLKTLATSYQSCEVGTAGALTKSVPDVQGIKIVGTASDGIGSLREVSDLPALVRTHPYLATYKKPSPATCFDVTKNPLIYDYGGRPLVTSAGTFDFFKNSGPTKALGTDCSGYVYMALATAGLRVKSGTKLKASTIYGISSSLFVNPKSNGLTCLDDAKFKGADTLRTGDILAKKGHVFIIDTVGKDPFGIAEIKTAAECKIENMSHERFDFTILQSSPSKGGIGIHRVQIKDYIVEAPPMLAGLLQHAVDACKAKFAPTTTIKTKSATTSLVRHLGTTACKDTAVAMERESCVSSCPLAN